MQLPPPPGTEHLSREELRERLWNSQGGPPLTFPWAGPVSDLYFGWHRLGRDMNGTSLQSERVSWLADNGWVEDGEREAGHYLFIVLENEQHKINRILYPPPKEK